METWEEKQNCVTSKIHDTWQEVPTDKLHLKTTAKSGMDEKHAKSRYA